METIKKNLANLVKVKTIVTMVVIAVFAVLALRGDIPADNVLMIVSAVIAFYFGTQHEKEAAIKVSNSNAIKDFVSVDRDTEEKIYTMDPAVYHETHPDSIDQ